MSSCYNCKKGGATLKCGRCKEANYCSKECQQTHWTIHKKICRQIAEIKGFVPPSRTEVLTGAEAAAAGLSTAGAGPSEDELRIAWAIAAAREADGGSSSSSDDWKSASFSGLPHDMAGKQGALYKACCTRRPAVNLARPGSNSNARGALASVDEASDDDKAALPSSTSTAVDAAAVEGGQDDAIVNLVSALLSSGCKADPPDSMGVPLHGAATAGNAPLLSLLLSPPLQPLTAPATPSFAPANVNRPTRAGQTALHMAIVSASPPSSSASVSQGTSAPATASEAQAAATAAAACVRVLASHGADFSLPASGVKHVATARPSARKPTLLHLAAASDGSADGCVMRAVIDGHRGWYAAAASTAGQKQDGSDSSNSSDNVGVSIDPLDHEGNSPLVYACVHGNAGAAAALIRAGAAVTPTAQPTSTDAVSAVSTAAAANPLEALCESAFEAAVNISVSSSEAEAVTWQSAVDRYASLASTLVGAGARIEDDVSVAAADLGVTIPANPTPISSASTTSSSSSSSSSAPLMLTPLSAACTHPCLGGLVASLVGQSTRVDNATGSIHAGSKVAACNPSSLNSDGSTALHVAVACGNVEAARALVTAMASNGGSGGGSGGDASAPLLQQFKVWLSSCLSHGISQGTIEAGSEEEKEMKKLLAL